MVKTTSEQDLEAQLDVWLARVRGIDEAALRVPVGVKEPFPEARPSPIWCCTTSTAS